MRLTILANRKENNGWSSFLDDVFGDLNVKAFMASSVVYYFIALDALIVIPCPV
jgi:hypothetical protein